MLNIFTLANGRLFQEEIESLEELSRFQPIWVDLESPTLEEKRWVKQYFGLSIPEDAMDEDIEESARFYEEDNGELHVRSDFLIDDAENPRSVRVAFILNQHNTELRSRMLNARRVSITLRRMRPFKSSWRAISPSTSPARVSVTSPASTCLLTFSSSS